MPFSISSYEVSEGLPEAKIKKLNAFSDDKKAPMEIAKLVKEIDYSRSKYYLFEIAKKFKEMVTEYKVENNTITTIEKETDIWKKALAYISENSKIVYLMRETGWPVSMISKIIFDGREDKIVPREINIKKIEEDIRQNNRFTFNGTSFEEADGTKVSISNPSGIDIKTDKHVKDTKNIEKKNLKILIQKDDKNFNVMIYPNGKITFGGRITDEESALSIFTKVFDEIKEYSS